MIIKLTIFRRRRVSQSGEKQHLATGGQNPGGAESGQKALSFLCLGEENLPGGVSSDHLFEKQKTKKLLRSTTLPLFCRRPSFSLNFPRLSFSRRGSCNENFPFLTYLVLLRTPSLPGFPPRKERRRKDGDLVVVVVDSLLFSLREPIQYNHLHS